MADDIRAKAKDWMDKNLAPGAMIYSDNGKFLQLTGFTHQHYIDAWKAQEGKPPGRPCETCCGAFAGVFTKSIGLPYLGTFFPEKYLKDAKKEYAWVPASADVRPKYGDVVRHKSFHVGISLDFDGEKWNTAEGGQGGPKYEDKEPYKFLGGRDLICRLERKYNHTSYIGWIDIDLFANGPPEPLPQLPPPTPNPSWPARPDAGTTGSLWVNTDGDIVHPDAPAGGGGPGFFGTAGIVSADPFFTALPHPWGHAGRKVDPLAILELTQEREEDSEKS